MFLISCENEESTNQMIPDGTYTGTFQREFVGALNDTANITLSFVSDQWSGSGDRMKYPALCHGTYSIDGDTIIFVNDCAWTAEFDWSLILAGKYTLKQSGNTIEFTKDYHPLSSGTFTDKFQVVKQR